MDNIYIVGFMGTGKTSVGKLLAKALDREFVEMDASIEQDQSKPIAKIFAEEGEAHFRQLEKELLTQLALRSGLVVSCGGGLICDQDNLRLLKASGVIFNLAASASTIYQRIKEHTHRPLLEVDDPLKRIEELLIARKAYYEKADQTIDTNNLSPQEVVESIVKLIQPTNG